MAVYTVHEPPPKSGDSFGDSASQLERFKFVRDGFSFWAFLLAPLWMLRHRLWLVFAGYVLVMIALQVGLRSIGATATMLLVATAFVSLLVGFEAATLRRFALSRRQWKNVGVVVGDDLEAAERRFFDAWFQDTSLAGHRSDNGSRALSLPAAAVPPLHTPRISPEVIGLFPQPGAPR